MEYGYTSTYTGRPLVAEYWKETAAIAAHHPIKLPGTLSRLPMKYSRSHQEAVTHARKARTETRLMYGFDHGVESTIPPFRSFMALDNLVQSKNIFLIEEDEKGIMKELRREKNKRKIVPSHRFSCNVSKAVGYATAKSVLKQKEKLAAKNLMERKVAKNFRVVGGCTFWQTDHTAIQHKEKEALAHEVFTGSNVEDMKQEEQVVDEEVSSTRKWIPGRRNETEIQNRFTAYAKQGNLNGMKTMMRNHVHEIDIDALGSNGENALHCACYNANLKVIEYLLKSGAKAKVLNSKSENLGYILENGNASRVDHPNHTSISVAAAWIDTSRIWKAAQSGNSERVEWLVTAGFAAVNEKNRHGMTPLHFAYLGEHVQTVLVLLGLAADTECLNTLSQRPRDMASEDFHDQILKGECSFS